MVVVPPGVVMVSRSDPLPFAGMFSPLTVTWVETLGETALLEVVLDLTDA